MIVFFQNSTCYQGCGSHYSMMSRPVLVLTGGSAWLWELVYGSTVGRRIHESTIPALLSFTRSQVAYDSN